MMFIRVAEALGALEPAAPAMIGIGTSLVIFGGVSWMTEVASHATRLLRPVERRQ